MWYRFLMNGGAERVRTVGSTGQGGTVDGARWDGVPRDTTRGGTAGDAG